MANTQAELILYHAAPSRSSIARWMLEEVGADYEIAVIDTNKGEQLEEPFLNINPMGKVPALVHRGVIITEVAAICCYLADEFAKAGLAPAVGDPRRGPYLKWMFFGPSCIEPAMIDKAMKRPEVKRATRGWGDFDTTMKVLSEALSDRPFILGDTFSAADVVIGSQIRLGLGFKIFPELPVFMDYAARLGDRPALQRQIAADEALASNG